MLERNATNACRTTPTLFQMAIPAQLTSVAHSMKGSTIHVVSLLLRLSLRLLLVMMPVPLSELLGATDALRRPKQPRRRATMAAGPHPSGADGIPDISLMLRLSPFELLAFSGAGAPSGSAKPAVLRLAGLVGSAELPFPCDCCCSSA